MTSQTSMTKSDALAIQVGGSHYKKLAMQPVVFATVNRYDPCAFSILKYVTRWRDKNGIQDLEKAVHFAQLRMSPEIAEKLPKRNEHATTVSSTNYSVANQIPPLEADILDWLEHWVYSPKSGGTGAHVIRLLQQLISENGG